METPSISPPKLPDDGHAVVNVEHTKRTLRVVVHDSKVPVAALIQCVGGVVIGSAKCAGVDVRNPPGAQAGAVVEMWVALPQDYALVAARILRIMAAVAVAALSAHGYVVDERGHLEVICGPN